jgi:homoserine dehydrogenase
MQADLLLIGFGNVGRRFVRLLDERGERLAREWDLTCRVTGVATRAHGAVYDASGVDALAAAVTIENGQSLDDPSSSADATVLIDRLARSAAPIRVVVETTTLDIAAGQPATDFVRRAMANGCHAVTANKGPASFAYDELSTLARRRGVLFLFEGAVMDGIPVFNLARDTMPLVTVNGFRGVVNSTTNHILTALERDEELEPALARMQAEGIAERDASLDIDGWDAAAKAAILANVFLGARVTPHDVDRTGIGPESAACAREALRRGRRLRLIASAERGSRPVVRPMELAHDDMLAGLTGTANALILDTDTLGRIAITQLDGGLTHTAYALLSDLITIRRTLRQ